MATNETLDIGDFNPAAFDQNCNVNVVGGCRTSVEGNLPGEKSVVDQFADILSTTSTIKGSSTSTNYGEPKKDTDQELVSREGGKVEKKKGILNQ